jgi:hypothetical protein
MHDAETSDALQVAEAVRRDLEDYLLLRSSGRDRELTEEDEEIRTLAREDQYSWLCAMQLCTAGLPGLVSTAPFPDTPLPEARSACTVMTAAPASSKPMTTLIFIQQL